MPFVLSLKDGKNATLFSVRHFEKLIDEYMGTEAAKYFRTLLSDRDEIIENKRNHVGELKDIIHGLETKVEELECDFNDE